MSKNPSCAMDSQLGGLVILKEALYAACKNKKLMLPVLLLAILPSSLFSLGNYVSLYPLLLNFIIKLYLLDKEDPSTPQFYDIVIGIKGDAEAFLHVNNIFNLASYILSLFSMLFVVLAFAMTYSRKDLTLHDFFLRIKRTWKGLLVTRIYFTLLYIGYTVLLVSLIAVLMLNAGGSIELIVVAALLGFLARLLYVYLSMAWMVGLVISVLEDSCYGLEALSRAGELVRGRRVQGFAIGIILQVLDGVLTGGIGFGTTKAHPQVRTPQTAGLVVVNALLILKMFSLMVYTVFYYECKKSHESKLELPGDFTYTRVKTTPRVDEALP